MSWLEVTVVAGAATAEAVAEALASFAPGGVALEQRGDPDDLAPDALLPEVYVKIYLPGREDSGAQRAHIAARVAEVAAHMDTFGPIGAPSFRLLADTDWAEAWKRHYTPFRVGRRLLIVPGWWTGPGGAASAGPDDLVVTLDPGMAFGTGLHASTRLCLEALERVVRRGDRVLDVGTGSGILAIAAARLGATSVRATDIDEVAVATARANARANGVATRVAVTAGALPADDGRWDVVVVNILAPVIVELLRDRRLVDYVGRDLLLSGVVDTQQATVVDAITAVGGEVRRISRLEDWICLWVRVGDEPTR